MKAAALTAAMLGVAVTSGFAQSESVRPLFVRENRFPELHKAEVGVLAGYGQQDEYFVSRTDPQAYADEGYLFVDKKAKLKTASAEPYVRYGVFKDVTLYARAPVSSQKSEAKDKTATGFNDLVLGMELLAYEYTYKYPWVIPYIEVSFPTGEAKKHMGLGEMDGIFGVAVGTTTFDKYTWVLDGRYDTNAQKNGRFEGAAAFIWALSDQFSVLGEAKATEKPEGSTKDVPVYFNGGMCYRPVENLSINLYGGKCVNAEDDGHGVLKLAYSF